MEHAAVRHFVLPLGIEPLRGRRNGTRGSTKLRFTFGNRTFRGDTEWNARRLDIGRGQGIGDSNWRRFQSPNLTLSMDW